MYFEHKIEAFSEKKWQTINVLRANLGIKSEIVLKLEILIFYSCNEMKTGFQEFLISRATFSMKIQWGPRVSSKSGFRNIPLAYGEFGCSCGQTVDGQDCQGGPS